MAMTTAHAGGLEPAIAAERESIEAEIAGGTLLTAFAETAERDGDTEAYRWRQDGEWRTLTYARLRDQVRDTALGLAAIGLRPGDFAVICSRNRPEANIAVTGTSSHDGGRQQAEASTPAASLGQLKPGKGQIDTAGPSGGNAFSLSARAGSGMTTAWAQSPSSGRKHRVSQIGGTIRPGKPSRQHEASCYIEH